MHGANRVVRRRAESGVLMIEVLSPVGWSEGFAVEVEEPRLADRPPSLEGLTLGLLCNGKPNAAELLRAIERHLGQYVPLRGSVFVDKNPAGLLASDEAPEWMLERVCAADVLVHA